ncbi:MAG: response regulator [Candidatus Parabeggiatoa sp.]|nr:response regulator [Candidatus Parabeggiatoa sp.]
MFNWFNNLKIRNKLIIAGLVMISLSLLISLIAILNQNNMQTIVTNVINVDGRVAQLNLQSQIAMLMARRSEKDYFLRYKQLGFEQARAQYVAKVQTQISDINTYLAEIKELEKHQQHIAAITVVEQAMMEYQNIFLVVVDLIEKRGFKDSGLEGQFRQKVHAIEAAVKDQNLNLLRIDMLMMRRFEKDYLLRADENDITRLHETVAQFKVNVTQTDLSSFDKQRLTTLAKEYQTLFEKLVQINQKIASLMDRYRAVLHRIEPLLEQNYKKALEDEKVAQENIQTVAKRVREIIIGVSLAVVIISLLLAIFLAGLISKPLALIVQGAQLLTAGNTALTGLDKTEMAKLTYRGDEMGDIGRTFDALASYFKEVIEDIVQISQGLASGQLRVMPQAEYRGDFVQIKQALETTLSNQSLVIEDIVQVSQGLAKGLLSVTPQSEYQGDFIQIKEALEIALFNQRQVIEDIVQVSQGLAEGKLDVMPSQEYQGDFRQIKQALEIALSNQRLVIEDIVRVSQGLAEGNLSIRPQSEYRGDFRHIKNAQETVLSNQRLVIEDIVQVSQGLAAGDLHVMSQAQYQGDFVQIKQALETALYQLGQVVEDIVQVSQGLAEGAEGVTPQAKYQGDFIQIKNALESATTKLAEATAKNAEQYWLKTGQTRLNDHIRGELEIVKLAKNIISFLTTYVEAQVGLFYLIKETKQQPYLHIIASYAYTTSDNIPDKFLLGEGLVGQAALEQKTLFRTQRPEEYTHIIQSGLSQAVPRYVMLMPFLYDNQIKGVIEIGSSKALTVLRQQFLEQMMPSIGIAINTAQSRTRQQALLEQSQRQTEELQTQSEELQTQQEELQQINEELQNQREELETKQAELQQRNEELQSQSEELQSQSEELQTQQEELKQTNEALEERTKELEAQTDDIQQKNRALEHSQVEMETARAAIEIKANELELASQYKSEFLANMSHELRTPLNSLLILAQLLGNNKSGNLTDKQVSYAQTIQSAGSDLLTLINDILDLSKVEAGKMEVNIEAVSLSDLMETLEQKFSPLTQEKGLAFHIHQADNLPALLQTDAQRLKQILNNLLSNAFKFTTEGEIKLSLNPKSDWIAISVIDTGIGIPQDKQQQIFEAFQQVDGTTSRRYGGTGLGLSISRQLARLLGGEITLHSEEGSGSTFTLSLPQTLPLPTTVSQPSNIVDQATASPKPKIIETARIESHVVPQEAPSEIKDDRASLTPEDKTLLIIEDDRQFSNIIIDLGREKGFKCLLAEDGRIGLQLAQEYHPHAIILDIGLPSLDGWTVMEKLKDNPETRHILVHFISAGDKKTLDATKMGAIGFLQKPVNIEQLGEVFKKIEHFINKAVKEVLVIVDNEPHQQKILELVGGDNIEITVAMTRATALGHLRERFFDCIIFDIEIENGSGGQLLNKMQQEEGLCQTPVIVYADRELTPEEEALLLQCSDHLPVKTVQSSERLLDEATLFLHQVEAHLPTPKRQMLRMVHDKESILTHKKVLIVDDDVRNVFALATVLEEKNMEVIAGNNGLEALELLAEQPDISIVLMDIMMPEMDGYEAMRKIRKQPQHRKLPIIALTAKAMKGDKAKCIDAGANDYLSKPVDTDKLISLMRVWLYR